LLPGSSCPEYADKLVTAPCTPGVPAPPAISGNLQEPSASSKDPGTDREVGGHESVLQHAQPWLRQTGINSEKKAISAQQRNGEFAPLMKLGA